MTTSYLSFAPAVTADEAMEKIRREAEDMDLIYYVYVVDGRERLAAAGDVLHFPADCRHGAEMLDEAVVLVDIFSPIREDFLPPAP